MSLSTADQRNFIERAAWFEGAPEVAVDKLLAAAVVRRFNAGSHIWGVGQKPAHIYGLLNGRVRLYQSTESGQEYALVDWEEGAWLGEQSLADDSPSTLGVKVMADTDILLIPTATAREVGALWPQLYQNLFRHDWANIHGLYEILSSLAFYPLRARVAGRVLLLLEEHGQRVEDGVLIDIKMSQNDFARLSLGSRQRVNSIFREWTKNGFLETRDELLLIKDIPALTAEIAPFE